MGLGATPTVRTRSSYRAPISQIWAMRRREGREANDASVDGPWGLVDTLPSTTAGHPRYLPKTIVRQPAACQAYEWLLRQAHTQSHPQLHAHIPTYLLRSASHIHVLHMRHLLAHSAGNGGNCTSASDHGPRVEARSRYGTCRLSNCMGGVTAMAWLGKAAILPRKQI